MRFAWIRRRTTAAPNAMADAGRWLTFAVDDCRYPGISVLELDQRLGAGAMRKSFSLIGYAALTMFSVFGTAGAVTIDTTPGWTGAGYIFAGADGGGGKYGQVFTVPLGENILESFTFFISGSSPPVLFKGELAQWNAVTFETGPLLYTSEIVSNAAYPFYNGTISGYAKSTFTIPGGLALIPGAQYAAILDNEPGNGSGAIGNNFDVDAYAGGYHLFWSASGSFWYNADDTRDYAFLAVLSAPSEIPEPGSKLLLITALIGLVVGLGGRNLLPRYLPNTQQIVTSQQCYKSPDE